MGSLVLGLAGATAPSRWQTWLESPLVKAPLPIPLLVLLLLVVWVMFRGTWKELDREAWNERGHFVAAGRWDSRPLVAMVITAIVLTTQEYYGGSTTYRSLVYPLLADLEKMLPKGVFPLAKYDQLLTYGWWALTRVFGYVLIPLPLWKLLYPRDSILDMGFRVKGIWRHWWVYTASLFAVSVGMVLVARQPDFGTYYPFYKQASRSWLDLVAWESMYFAQFLALEIFFRGWMLGAVRKSLGSGAIFAMAVPYCMIHYGKPYLEANGAIVAGIFLGSLAMKTRSIYAGFLVHITVALSMDLLALFNRGALPIKLLPP